MQTTLCFKPTKSWLSRLEVERYCSVHISVENRKFLFDRFFWQLLTGVMSGKCGLQVTFTNEASQKTCVDGAYRTKIINQCLNVNWQCRGYSSGRGCIFVKWLLLERFSGACQESLVVRQWLLNPEHHRYSSIQCHNHRVETTWRQKK